MFSTRRKDAISTVGSSVIEDVRSIPSRRIQRGDIRERNDNVAQKAYPYLPVRLLMKDRFDSKQKMAKIFCPALFIHGESGFNHSFEVGSALYEVAHEPKTWFPIAEADHNDLPWVGGQTYLDGIQGFLQQAKAERM